MQRARIGRIGIEVSVLALAIGLLPGPGEAREPSAAEWWSGRADGVRCETRNEAREVSWRNFVIDRITTCRPVGVSPAAAGPTIELILRDCAEKAGEEGEYAEVLPASVEGARSGAPMIDESSERLVRWSPDRSRLANAQFDRSMREMQESFRRPLR